jgi:hypothetical protein
MSDDQKYALARDIFSTLKIFTDMRMLERTRSVELTSKQVRVGAVIRILHDHEGTVWAENVSRLEGSSKSPLS